MSGSTKIQLTAGKSPRNEKPSKRQRRSPSCAYGSAGAHGYGAQVGYYRDPETELYLMGGGGRGRYYDPSIGRFTTEDPIGFNGGDPNLYRYVGNNPVNAIDPSGNVEDGRRTVRKVGNSGGLMVTGRSGQVYHVTNCMGCHGNRDIMTNPYLENPIFPMLRNAREEIEVQSNEFADDIEKRGVESGMPAVAGTAAFAGYASRLSGGMTASIVDFPGTIEGEIDRVESNYELSAERYDSEIARLFLTASKQTGVSAVPEYFGGYDIADMRQLHEEEYTAKASEGLIGVSGVILTVAPAAKFIPRKFGVSKIESPKGSTYNAHRDNFGNVLSKASRKSGDFSSRLGALANFVEDLDPNGIYPGGVDGMVREILQEAPWMEKYFGEKILNYSEEYVQLMSPVKFEAERQLRGAPMDAAAFFAGNGVIYLNRARGTKLLRDLIHESIHAYDFGKGGKFEGRSLLKNHPNPLTPQELWRLELRAKSAEIMFDHGYTPFGNMDIYYRWLQSSGASPY